jgi:A/G-specific adenine glycosylase
MPPLTTSISPQKFHQLVFAWFDLNGRKNLPWQQNKSPYRVWISEIMLQQTQVATVIPYFLRFLEKFPDIQALAAAPQDEVLHLWTGLGYYNRARNLHQTAKIIQQQNYFPDELNELENLPGIGRSTAGAILAIAFEKTATILDGNVKRVLTRLMGITEWPGEKKTLDRLWQIAEHLTPKKRIADYTQAMMDLGATVCVRGKPHCSACPLKAACIAHNNGIERTLPRPKPKKIIPTRAVTFLIFKYQDKVLLLKRPPAGVWQGLWSVPEIPGLQSLTQIKKHCKTMTAHSIQTIELGECFRHTFSHFHLDILPVVIHLKKLTPQLNEDAQNIWYNLSHPSAIGLPAPIKKLLSTLTQ